MVLPAHEISTLTKFHCNRANIVDFLVMGKFGASSVFFASVSMIKYLKSATMLLFKLSATDMA